MGIFPHFSAREELIRVKDPFLRIVEKRQQHWRLERNMSKSFEYKTRPTMSAGFKERMYSDALEGSAVVLRPRQHHRKSCKREIPQKKMNQ